MTDPLGNYVTVDRRHTSARRLIKSGRPARSLCCSCSTTSRWRGRPTTRLTDQTVRRGWEQPTKVNINGQRVTLDPEGHGPITFDCFLLWVSRRPLVPRLAEVWSSPRAWVSASQ